jgi:predicted Na+-dependent transporter
MSTTPKSTASGIKGFLNRNWFVASLPVAVLLAFLLPEAGATGGWFRSEITTRLGVALIFLFQGLVLPTAALRQGASRWPLHLLIQSFTFLIFPLMGIGLDAAVGQHLPPDLRLGFLFLCVLPSTVSTSVVLTGLAGGNTVGAIFNAALSNVIGVVITPLWVAWLMKTGGGQADLGGVIREIIMLLLLPLAAGQLLRWKVSLWADRNRKALGNASSALILFLVFAAFCNSARARFWSGLGGGRAGDSGRRGPPGVHPRRGPGGGPGPHDEARPGRPHRRGFLRTAEDHCLGDSIGEGDLRGASGSRADSVADPALPSPSTHRVRRTRRPLGTSEGTRS